MQYGKYEKLIVVGKGVELINWPDMIPFVNASGIRSLHNLHLLHTTLTLEEIGQHCHWVTISKEEWEK